MSTSDAPLLLTFGHGRADRAQLARLLTAARVGAVVDVRRFPGSRSNPAAAAGQIEELCRELGIDYRHEPRLGGRRRLTAAEDAAARDTWWRVAAFRAYAAYTRSDEFRAGLHELLAGLSARRTAVMCSEAVWWRCHRRLISDVAALESGCAVRHLLHDGTVAVHPVAAGARLDIDGRVVWDDDQ